MGAFLRHKAREDYTLSTKVGRLLVPQDADGRMDEDFAVPATHRRVWDFSRDGVRRSVEDSLARMGVDRFDTLYLHDAETASTPRSATATRRSRSCARRAWWARSARGCTTPAC